MTAATTTKHMIQVKPERTAGLTRAVHNALIFASPDGTLPFINAIRFEFAGELQVVATDRYRLSFETVDLTGIDHTGQPPFDFLLPAVSAKALLAFLKTNRRDPITLLFDAEGGTLHVGALESSVEYRLTEGSFPAWRQLLPKAEDAAPVNRIGFNPAFLADLARVQSANKVDTVAIQLFGEKAPGRAKATLVEFLAGPTVLLMPITLPAAG